MVDFRSPSFLFRCGHGGHVWNTCKKLPHQALLLVEMKGLRAGSLIPMSCCLLFCNVNGNYFVLTRNSTLMCIMASAATAITTSVFSMESTRGSMVVDAGMIRRALENAESQLSNAPRINPISHFLAFISCFEKLVISESWTF